MTAASGLPEHLDPDALADLAEGLLAPDAADAARRHLGTCPICADDFALISGDYALSPAATAPEPIPAEVFARVEAALYREPPLSVATAPKPSAATAHKPTPRPARTPWSSRFKLAVGSLAGGTALLVVGYFGVAALSSSSAEKSSAMTTARGAAAAPNAVPEPGASAGAEVGVEQLAAQLLSGLPSGHVAATNGTSNQSPDALGARCWYDPRPGTAPLASAPTTYLGRAAELVVYAVPGDSTKADVFVVTTTCVPVASESAETFSGATSAAAGVLDQVQVARP